MTWPADHECCYGVCCELHGSCARYIALDGNTNKTQPVRAMCPPDRPLYIPIKPEKEKANA